MDRDTPGIQPLYSPAASDLYKGQAAAEPVDASNASSRGGRSRRGAWLARLTVAAAFAGVVVAAAIQPRRRISRGAAPGLVSHPMQSSRC